MIISALVYREAVEEHDILAFLDILIEKIISRKKRSPTLIVILIATYCWKRLLARFYSATLTL